MKRSYNGVRCEVARECELLKSYADDQVLEVGESLEFVETAGNEFLAYVNWEDGDGTRKRAEEIAAILKGFLAGYEVGLGENQ